MSCLSALLPSNTSRPVEPGERIVIDSSNEIFDRRYTGDEQIDEAEEDE